MFEKYYKILNIPESSDEDAIKKAYRQLALRIHPDVNRSPDATEKFRELCEAYEIILSHTAQTRYMDVSSGETAYEKYNWEDVIREAQKKAKARARMRYEKIRAEQELFEKSEWRDVIIALKYFWSVVALGGGIWLVAWPLYTAVTQGLQLIFAMMFFWVAGFFLLRHIYKNRKTWFRHGRLNLSFNTIREFFDFRNFSEVKSGCAYCKGHRGTGRPFKLTMLKVRSIQTRNDGPLQHYVRYGRNYKDLFVPRSRKAFYTHFSLSLIKPLILFAGILFIPFPSLVWRFFTAFFIALLTEVLILILTQTRSKVSYLLTPFVIIKIVVWLLVMMTQTYVYPGFILGNNDILILLMGIMIVFLDMILDLILRIFPFHAWFYLPIPSQLPGITYLFRKGYQPYLDVPIWSTLYPFFRWLF